MALPPIVSATLTAAVISGISNIIAQAITSYKEKIPFVINWVPIFQFFVFTCIQTPPNFVWQSFLEETFPAYYVAPTKEAIASAAANDDKALDREAREGRLVEPKLNVRNTAIKFVLDQTVGAAVNTMLFGMGMGSIKASMAHAPGAGKSVAFLTSGNAVDYSAVNWDVIYARARSDFWSLMKAGATFWPFISLLNFTAIKSVEGRNLVGSLAGVIWGVYISLFTAGN